MLLAWSSLSRISKTTRRVARLLHLMAAARLPSVEKE
jgi:hypothetical protein